MRQTKAKSANLVCLLLPTSNLVAKDKPEAREGNAGVTKGAVCFKPDPASESLAAIASSGVISTGVTSSFTQAQRRSSGWCVSRGGKTVVGRSCGVPAHVRHTKHARTHAFLLRVRCGERKKVKRCVSI